MRALQQILRRRKGFFLDVANRRHLFPLGVATLQHPGRRPAVPGGGVVVR